VEVKGMRITVVGALLIIAVVVLLALLIYFLAGKGGSDPKNSNQGSP